MLNELQQKWCDDGTDDCSDLKALFLNCTLKKSPDPSHTEGLFQISRAIMGGERHHCRRHPAG